MADQTVKAKLASVLGRGFLREPFQPPRGERIGGWRHIKSMAKGLGRRRRSGEKRYGMNGERPVVRRRRQIACGMLRMTQQ